MCRVLSGALYWTRVVMLGTEQEIQLAVERGHGWGGWRGPRGAALCPGHGDTDAGKVPGRMGTPDTLPLGEQEDISGKCQRHWASSVDVLRALELALGLGAFCCR